MTGLQLVARTENISLNAENSMMHANNIFADSA